MEATHMHDFDGAASGEPTLQGAFVGVVAFDAGFEAVSYAMVDGFGGAFAIDPRSGVVTVADAARIGDAKRFKITVRANTRTGATSVQAFAVLRTDAETFDIVEADA